MRKITLSCLLFLMTFLSLGALCAAAPVPSSPAGRLTADVDKDVKAGSGTHTVTLQGCVDTTPNVGFYFYRGTAAGQESATALNATPAATCTFVDVTVIGNTTYYYTAKAYLSTAAAPGLSTASNEVVAVVPPDPAPAAPTGLSLGTVAENSVPLKWNAPASQEGYVVVAYEVLRGAKATLPSPAIVAIVPSSMLAWSDGSCSGCYYAVRSMTIKSADSFVLSARSNIVGPS